MASAGENERAHALAQAFGALSHPVRIRALRQFERGGKLSPSGLKEAMPDVPLGTLAYHVRQLAGAGLLKPAGRAQRRGTIEHLYVLTSKGTRTAGSWTTWASKL
jgi:DNA-binding transcriptional ArsR family regulator